MSDSQDFGPINYTLVVPVEITTRRAGVETANRIEELVIRRPKAKDMRALDSAKGDMAQTLLMIERLPGLQQHEVDDIELIDVHNIGEIFGGFTPHGPQNGPTPSDTRSKPRPRESRVG